MLPSLPASPPDLPNGLLIVTILQWPESTGELRMVSFAPRVLPELNFNYFATGSDRRRMFEGERMARDIAESASFRKILCQCVSPSSDELASDHKLESRLMTNVRTAYHASGTAKMGPTNDPLGVVDERRSVRGVEGLRVADLSIAPIVSRGSTHPAAVMIGERVAESMNA